MDEHPAGRRESDPRITNIERSLNDLTARFTIHEQGGLQRGNDIRALKEKVDDVSVALRALPDIETKVSEHHEILFGDGNGKVGLLIKIDRLIQLGETVKKILWLLFSLGVTGFVTALIAHLVNPRLP